MSELQEGFNKGISNTKYHADRTRISSSGLKAMLNTPRIFYNRYILNTKLPQKNQTALDIGSYTHGAILEPELLDEEFAEKIEAPYVATASVGYLADYIKKLKAAKSAKGFKFIDLLCPCPSSWDFDPSLTIDIGRISVNTNLWPLFQRVKDKKRLTFKPKTLESLQRYTEIQGRYKNLNKEGMAACQRQDKGHILIHNITAGSGEWLPDQGLRFIIRHQSHRSLSKNVPKLRRL